MGWRELGEVVCRLERRDRRGRGVARLLDAVERPQGRGRTSSARPRVRASGASATASSAASSAGLHPPREVRRAREAQEQIEPLGGGKLRAEPQRPFELERGLAQRADALGVGSGEGGVAARVGGEAGALGVVGEPRVLGRALLQRGDDARVQLRAPRRGDRVLDRLPRQLVAEAERGAVVGQHAVRERLLDGVRAGDDRRQQVGRHPLPDHRRGVDHAARVGAEAADARQRRVAQRGGEPAARGERLGDQERVAAGQPRELGGVDPRGIGELADRGGGERGQRHPRGVGAGGEVADEHGQRGVGGEFVVAVGDEHDDARVFHPAGEEPEDVERRRVGPVRVLEHGDGRRPLAQEGEQRAGEERARRRPLEVGGELAQRGERDRDRQRLAGADQERCPPLEPPAQRAHQRGLADPGLARDQHEPAAPGLDDRLQLRGFPGALQQLHGAILRPRMSPRWALCAVEVTLVERCAVLNVCIAGATGWTGQALVRGVRRRPT